MSTESGIWMSGDGRSPRAGRTPGKLTAEIHEEALALLCDLLRIDTTNPPGNERPAAELCAEALRAEGLEPKLLEGAKDRTNLICRYRGTGELPPLMLTAHLDVVPPGDGWTHPPFEARIVDGWLYGRGAIDMKNHVAMCVTVLRALAREKARLRRDVLLVLVADEEAGCTWGSEWLVRNHADKIRAEYALGEIGGFPLHMEGRRIYPIQVAQKGVLWLRARTRGEGGHGSMPRERTAVGDLVRAVSRLVRRPMPIEVTPPAREFLDALAAQLGPKGAALRALSRPWLARAVLRALPDRSLARTLRALLSNTVTVNVLRAGEKTNVIPRAAEAEIDCRTLPGKAGEKAMQQIRDRVGPEVEFEVLQQAPAVEFTSKTPLFESLAAAIRRADPEAVVIPYMIPGFTDALAFAHNGTTCYGFTPVYLPEGVVFADLYHNVDERIWVEGFHFGLELLYDAVRTFCAEG